MDPIGRIRLNALNYQPYHHIMRSKTQNDVQPERLSRILSKVLAVSTAITLIFPLLGYFVIQEGSKPKGAGYEFFKADRSPLETASLFGSYLAGVGTLIGLIGISATFAVYYEQTHQITKQQRHAILAIHADTILKYFESGDTPDMKKARRRIYLAGEKNKQIPTMIDDDDRKRYHDKVDNKKEYSNLAPFLFLSEPPDPKSEPEKYRKYCEVQTATIETSTGTRPVIEFLEAVELHSATELVIDYFHRWGLLAHEGAVPLEIFRSATGAKLIQLLKQLEPSIQRRRSRKTLGLLQENDIISDELLTKLNSGDRPIDSFLRSKMNDSGLVNPNRRQITEFLNQVLAKEDLGNVSTTPTTKRETDLHQCQNRLHLEALYPGLVRVSFDTRLRFTENAYYAEYFVWLAAAASISSNSTVTITLDDYKSFQEDVRRRFPNSNHPFKNPERRLNRFWALIIRIKGKWWW